MTEKPYKLYETLEADPMFVEFRISLIKMTG